MDWERFCPSRFELAGQQAEVSWTGGGCNVINRRIVVTNHPVIIVRCRGEDCHYKSPAVALMINPMLRPEYARLTLFDGLAPGVLSAIAPYMEEVRHPRGTTIFIQGQIADSLYILVDGEVRIRFKPYDGPVLTVARIHPGGVYGWSAVMGHELYTSGAQTTEDSVSLRIRNRNLQRLVETHPQAGAALLERLAASIAERLRNTHTAVLEILYQGLDPSAGVVHNQHGNQETAKTV